MRRILPVGLANIGFATMVLVCMGTPLAVAQGTVAFEKGDLVRQVSHWDTDAKRFVNRPAEGEGEGCWKITNISRTEIKMTLVSGRFKPWWSDEVIAIGSADTWFDSNAYVEANPGHPPLTEIGRTFKVVSSCK